MNHRVNRKQPNSKMCFVCGIENRYGLRSFFYELDNNELLALFTPRQEHQGYPGRLHGGIAAAILDETIGRAVMIKEGFDCWWVTIQFTSRFRKGVPLDERIRVIARMTKIRGRIFEGSGEILARDGTVAVEGYGRYMKLPLEKISSDFNASGDDWFVARDPSDPIDVEI